MTYSSVSLVSAALKGVTINGSSTPSSTDVTTWLQEVDSEIDTIFGRSFTSTTSTFTVDYDGSGYLRLPVAPIISTSTLIYYKNGLGNSSVSSTSLTEGRTNDFIVYAPEGEIKFFGNNAPTFGYKNVVWTGTYGYATTPAWVQRLATLMAVKRFVGATVSNTAQKGGRAISVGNLSLGAPSNFSAEQVRQINNEIDSIISSNISATHVFRAHRNYRK